MLQEGNPAPAFDMLNEDGKKIKLSEFKGEPVVLYFFPKADTPG